MTSEIMTDSGDFVTKIIKRPFIPFWELIEPSVDINTCVIVKGRVPRFANQFAFNFIVGKEISNFARNSSDIAFQFSPRFEDEGVVVTNARIDGHWGLEDRNRKDFPFARISWFEVKFVFKESYIKIYVDNIDVGLFIHRIPFQFIGIFSIEGDVEVESVVVSRDMQNHVKSERKIKQKMITNGETNGAKDLQITNETQIKQEIDHNLNVYTNQHSIVSNIVLTQKTIYNPPVPFCEPVFNCLKNGMTVTINGQTFSSPKNLIVRLQWPPSATQRPDVAISLNVSFDAKQVIRKCRVNGRWLKEEKEIDYFPFKSQQYFELKLEIKENRFVISFNGNRLAEYKSHIPDYSMANMLEIEGEIHLFYVKFDASQVN